MNEFNKEKSGQELAKVEPKIEEKATDFAGDLQAQAQEYGQKLQDAAGKARDYATEKFGQAGDKLKDLQNIDPNELLEEAKKYARQKPGEALLISAAVGVVLGLILRGRK